MTYPPHNHDWKPTRDGRTAFCRLCGTFEPSAEADAALVSEAWFQLARAFTYTGPHDRESAHGIVAEHRPAIEAAIRPATPPLDVERHREAVRRAWTQTHAPTPEAWSDVITAEYAALANPTPEREG